MTASAPDASAIERARLRSLAYAAEKFGSAVHAMAVSEAPLRPRVAAAYGQFHPVFVESMATRVPPHIASALTRLWARMTALGTLDSTLENVSDGEVRQIAEAITDLDADIGAAVLHARLGQWDAAGY